MNPAAAVLLVALAAGPDTPARVVAGYASMLTCQDVLQEMAGPLSGRVELVCVPAARAGAYLDDRPGGPRR